MNLPAPLQQIPPTGVRFGRRKLSYFAGCDYFRLSSHPAVARALLAGLRRYGLNVSASRLTTGNHALYEELETLLAEFFGVPSALLVSTGYAANAIAAQGLQESCSRVLIDSQAHSSLLDAGRMFRCPAEFFKHRDPQDLARILARRPQTGKTLLLTDGLFGGDGQIAPLAEYLKVLPSRALILVDDAHGAGVIGQRGRGTPEFCAVPSARIIQTITLSKAFGVYGGAILASGALREQIIDNSAMFAASTPLPLPLACAAKKAIQLLKSGARARARLQANVHYVKSALKNRCFPVPDTPAPIISVVPSSQRHAKALRRSLLSQNIFPSYIRYPGGPPQGCFRLVISSEHTRDQLARLLAALLG